MSHSTVLALIKVVAQGITLKPAKYHYRQVQIDEQWSYVGKKEYKVWMLYAYAVDEDKVIAFTLGKRNAETVSNLFVKLKPLNIDLFLTDHWMPSKRCFPKQSMSLESSTQKQSGK